MKNFKNYDYDLCKLWIKGFENITIASKVKYFQIL